LLWLEMRLWRAQRLWLRFLGAPPPPCLAPRGRCIRLPELLAPRLLGPQRLLVLRDRRRVLRTNACSSSTHTHI
jgi:hypothetical protein